MMAKACLDIKKFKESSYVLDPLYSAYEPDTGYTEEYWLAMDDLLGNSTYRLSDYSLYRQDITSIHEGSSPKTHLWPFIPQFGPQSFLAHEVNGQWFIMADSRRVLAADWIEVWDKATLIQETTRLEIPTMARILCYQLECPNPCSATDMFQHQFAPWFHIDVLWARYTRIHCIIQVLRGYCNFAAVHQGFKWDSPPPATMATPYPYQLSIYWPTHTYGSPKDSTLATPYQVHQLPFYVSIEEPLGLWLDPLIKEFNTSQPPPVKFLDKPLATCLVPATE